MSQFFYGAMETVRDAICGNKEFLTQLDGVIGDGDHGINMARGFEAAVKKLGEHPEIEFPAGLKEVGMTLISTVGGASGPLYGTAFLRAAGVAQLQPAFTPELAADMLSAAIGGIKQRGKAVRGEKTMIDALEPAYETLTEGLRAQKDFLQCLQMACTAAEEGVEYTKTIIARKGRASYLGERSLGHQDPGATSALMILKALTGYYRQTVKE